MPANNRRFAKAAAAFGTAATVTAGQSPAARKAAGLIFKKTLQEALLDGLEDIVSFAHDFLDVDPYAEQQVFLRAIRDTTEATLSAANRCGKSHLAGVVLLWRAFYRYTSPYTRPDRLSPHVTYKAVSTSLTQDQANLAFNYAHTFASGSKKFTPYLQDTIYSPFPTMTLRVKNEKNDWVQSEIWARSLSKGGVYLLGHSLGFVLVDETAFIPRYPEIESTVIRMRLADQAGSILRISSPNGRNHFYDLWSANNVADPRYFAYRIPTTANPYVSKVFLEEQKQRMTPEMYAQNVLAEWVAISDFFKTEQVQALYDGVEYSLPQEPVKGHDYVLGMDLGALRDPTVIYILDISVQPHRVVALYEVKNGSWASARALANGAYNRYKPVYSAVDATGVGRPITQQLIEEDGWENTEEFIFGAQSKPELLTHLQDAVQRRALVFPYTSATQTLVNQLSFYKLDDKQIATDHVMALALAVWAVKKSKRVDYLDTTIYDDLAVISVRNGGGDISEAALSDGYEGPGFLFDLDSDSGLFVPRDGSNYDLI